MRTLIQMSVPVEAGNVGVRDGVIAEVVQAFMAAAKPESAVFTAVDGKRTMLAVFDLASASDIPRLCEPFFQRLNAAIDLTPCMNADDLAAGLASLG